MKIASFLHRADFGGAQWRVVLIGEELKKNGVSTTVIFPKNQNVKYENFLKARNFPYFRIRMHVLRKPSRVLNNIYFFICLPVDLLRTIFHISSNDYSIVHVNGLTNFVPVLCARILNRKVLWHMNDTLTPKWLYHALSPLVRSTYVCAASNAVSEKYELAALKRSYLGILPPPISGASDASSFDADKDIHFPGMQIIGFVGNLVRLKGIEDYLKVIHRHSQNQSNVIGLVVGDYIETDHDYKNYIHGLIEQLGIQDRIIFLGYRPDVINVMKKFNLLLYPSHSEAAPIVVLQALYAGIPIVGCDAGSLCEWLSSCDMPVVSVGDLDGLAMGVSRVLSLSDYELKMYREKACKFVESFTVESVTSRHYSLYKIISEEGAL